MTEEAIKVISATNTITTFEKFKRLILDMLKGYPQYVYFGKFESVFKENGKNTIDLLVRHGVIEKISKKEVKKLIRTMPLEELEKLPKMGQEFVLYRLTPKGIDIAISLINLDYSERTLGYSKEMRFFTVTIIILTVLTLDLGMITLYFQFFS